MFGPFWENLSLREHLQELEFYGASFHWLVLRSAHLDKYCECTNEVPLSQVGTRPPCKRCLSTGRMYTDYLMKGIQYLPTRNFAGDEIFAAPGVLHNSGRRYAFNVKDVVPKSTDLILEIDLNKDTGQPIIPIKILEVFNILQIRRLWGDRGREEYYIAMTEQRQIMPGVFSKDRKDVNNGPI